jgi:hypothetical protein
MILLLSEGAATAADYEDTLIPVALALTGIALAYAAVATWIVTPKLNH